MRQKNEWRSVSTKQPLIFYSEEMTDTKISLLELHGITVKDKEE